jgi:hypothetical protein
MKHGTPQDMQSRVLVARRYLEHGLLDAAMRLLVQNPVAVTAADWTELVDKLVQCNRIADAVRVAEFGGVPLPRQPLLELGDRHLDRRDAGSAIYYYEIGDADQQRWNRVVDVLTNSTDQELRAIEIAGRHLLADAVHDATPETTILAEAS